MCMPYKYPEWSWTQTSHTWTEDIPSILSSLPLMNKYNDLAFFRICFTIFRVVVISLLKFERPWLCGDLILLYVVCISRSMNKSFMARHLFFLLMLTESAGQYTFSCHSSILSEYLQAPQGKFAKNWLKNIENYAEIASKYAVNQLILGRHPPLNHNFRVLPPPWSKNFGSDI